MFQTIKTITIWWSITKYLRQKNYYYLMVPHQISQILWLNNDALDQDDVLSSKFFLNNARDILLCIPWKDYQLHNMGLIVLYFFFRKTLWNQYQRKVWPDRLSHRSLSKLIPLCAPHQWWIQMWWLSTTTLQWVLSADNSEVSKGVLPDISSTKI